VCEHRELIGVEAGHSLPRAATRAWRLALGAAPIVAATHIDGTSRPQTVPADGSPFRRLIEQFHADTGIPAVLNTSLNSGGEPIVESLEQALAFLFSTSADALVINHAVVLKEDQ
jgi:carbamoyltransferase